MSSDKNVTHPLIDAYARTSVRNALAQSRKPLPFSRIGASTRSNSEHMAFYSDPAALDKALEAIDLPKILSGVDRREKEQEDRSRTSGSALRSGSAGSHDRLGYDDHLAMETLAYFKNDFFKWVHAPPCTRCGRDGDNMLSLGAERPGTPGPDLVSVVEHYQCKECNEKTSFARINNPVSLLKSRTGRCVEWVNCFLLVLRAVLGVDSKVRYVWNHEDHVWCEYYSRALGRWVHMDPCENAWDQPALYCENWGKKMSWVIGIGNDYVVDLSSKYVTVAEKQTAKDLVESPRTVLLALCRINARLAERVWHAAQAQSASESDAYTRFYWSYLVPKNRDLLSMRPGKTPCVCEDGASRTTVRGRQSGSASWTAARGEDGCR